MFVNFRLIHKIQILRLLACMGLVLCVAMLCWEELDHHVVSHMRSYTYRYLVNHYDFLNSSYALQPDGHRQGSFGDPLHPYLINEPKKCAEEGEVLLVLFVKSSPENAARRKTIRNTWGDELYIWANFFAPIKVLFVLGVHPDEHSWMVQKKLETESWVYGDLIQQDFKDTFHNLTAKLILQFHWASKYCPKAKFVMSTDDDVFVHTPNLVRYLRLMEQKEVSNFWVGHVHRGAPPVRRKENKYFVPFELYPWPAYPDYTSGAGYLVSRDVVTKINRAMWFLNSSMYIDDVFMGICAATCGLYPQDYAFFSGEAKTVHHTCIYAKMLTSHGHVDDMLTLWKEATGPNVQKVSKGFLSGLYCMAVKAALLCRPHFPETYQCKAAFT